MRGLAKWCVLGAAAALVGGGLVRAEEAAPAPVPIRLADATADAGLAGAGGDRFSFGDYDADGDPDLLVEGTRLWRNDTARKGPDAGKIRFSDQSAATGMDKAKGGGACWLDMDGDGRLDAVTTGGSLMLQGKDHVEVPCALPGDIAAVAKVDDIHFDAVLHDAAEDDHIHLKPLDFPKPVHGIAVEARKRGDEQKMWEILGKLIDEDPCLKIEHVAQTNETIVYGLGELHLRMLLERMKETYKFEVNTRPPRIAYRETITAKAEGHHRHKKQTGGAGQFGEVFLRVEPLARGAGFEFTDESKGGVIPHQFIPAVEKGVREVLAGGAIAGYPVVDVKVTVYDGKHHSVDSKEIAFATAGRKAMLAAVREARPIVLEPVVHVEISAPDSAMGDVTGDLSSRRGQVSGTHNGAPGTMIVKGQAPLSELAGYQSRLNAMTAGQGRYTIAFSHYEAVPPNVQQQLVSAWNFKDEE
ncbi:MAG: hypothetical protein MUF63_10065 [Rhodobacteraceae bacterium]|nr:hypothetical protein [Paracoccaceae bacterium]